MSNPSRQPAGIPVGGQFAPDARGRSSVSLDPGHARPVRSRAEIRREIDALPMRQRREITRFYAPLTAQRLSVETLRRTYDREIANPPVEGSQREARLYAIELELAEATEASAAVKQTPPPGSAAAQVNLLADKPVDTWIDGHGDCLMARADGSYGVVHPDDEPTGHWFVDVVNADGSFGATPHGQCFDSKESAKFNCELDLRFKATS